MAPLEIPVEGPITKAEKMEAIITVGKSIDAQYKQKNSLVRMNDKVGLPVPSQSTGMPTVDWHLIQSGGVPRGRIIEIFGPESAGKTTITLQIIAASQAADGTAAFVDAEHALDPDYATKLGVNMDELFISQPDYGEQALEIVEALVRSGAVDVLVVDSVAALVPKAELDGDMGDSNVGLQARLMSQAMRKLTVAVSKSKTSLIFINQIREKIGVMFGSPETTTGGRALKFFSSLRLDVRKRKLIKVGGEDGKVIGNQMEIKAVKNKVGAPFRSTLIDLLYDTGIDKVADLINFADMVSTFEKKGSWFWLEGKQLANGKDKLVEMVKADPDLYAKILAVAYNKMARS